MIPAHVNKKPGIGKKGIVGGVALGQMGITDERYLADEGKLLNAGCMLLGSYRVPDRRFVPRLYRWRRALG